MSAKTNITDEIASAVGLMPEHASVVRDLVDVWRLRRSVNEMRTRYFDGKVTVADVNIGVALPKEVLHRIDVRSSWPRAAVEAISNRVQFDGFTDSDGGDGGVSEALDVRALAQGFDLATDATLTHGCAFATVTAGGYGEPPAVVNFHSAENASALWDFRTQRASAGLVVVDVERPKRSGTLVPKVVDVYLPDCVIVIAKTDGVWFAEYMPNPAGRLLFEPIVNAPRLGHPFGSSVLTQGMMSIVDCQVRELARLEISRELNAAPQKWMMGADESNLTKSRWEMYIGSWVLGGMDDDGRTPNVGQFPQVAVDTNALRLLAMEFSGVSHVPLCDLGFDANSNPSSAEAIYAQKESLVLAAADFCSRASTALTNVARLALAVANGCAVSELSDVQLSVRPNFRDPSMPSIVTQADGMMKAVTPAGAQWIAETDVYLKRLGFTDAERSELAAAKRRIDAKNALALVVGDDGDAR